MILHEVVENRSKPKDFKIIILLVCWVLCCALVFFFYPFALYFFLYRSVHESTAQWNHVLNAGATNKLPHPTQVLQPWFVLELCHNTLFYDTANLIWQLTATRQRNLPSSLSLLLALAMCVCLLLCLGCGMLPAPQRDGSVE